MMDAPAGFRLLEPFDEVMAALGPIFLRHDDVGHLTLGFRVARQHCNPQGSCHGGIWATFADLQLGMNVGLMTKRSGPTVSMSLDYLGSAQPGQWVEGTTRLLRETPKLAFVDATFTADGNPMLRASGIFRLKWQSSRHFADS